MASYFSAHTSFHWQKSYFQAPLLHFWTLCSGCPQSPTRGIQCTDLHRNTHVKVKIKASVLMHLLLGFLLFLLLMLHRCDSLSGILSWISHRQQRDDYAFNPSSLLVMMTLLFPFLDSALLSSHFNASFNFHIACLMACMYLLLILIPNFLHSRSR